MIIIILNNPPHSLAGALTKYLLKIPPYIYVGKLPRNIKDRIIDEIKLGIGNKGQATIIQTTNNNAGYDIKIFGNTSSEVAYIDGLPLIKRKEENSADIKQTWHSKQLKYAKTRKFNKKQPGK